MRIAHVTPVFPPYFSGYSSVCYYNALGLAQLGHQVTVFTANYPPGEYSYPPEITVKRLPTPFRIGNAPLTPGLLRLDGFDLVHLHCPYYLGAELILLKSLASDLRYVATYHQDVLFSSPLRYPAQLHHRWVEMRILRRAERVLATSWDYARASRVKELLRTCPGLVGVLPNGVDAQRFHPGLDASPLRARYGLDSDGRNILFVAALDKAHYFKGLTILLEVISRMSDVGIRLIVVGDGNLRPSYQQLAHDLGVQDRVVFCGRVSDEELPYYYALCDLHVLPSVTMGEAFGVVLLEAMACGKPVIASNLPGVRSVVCHGDDGLLVQPGDADDLAEKMQWLLNHPDHAREMGARGRVKVEARYDWPVIIPQLERIYEQVLEGD